MLSATLLAAAVTLQVPFVPQQKDTCGAAALAMVLQYYGRDVSHGAIAQALVEPELHGIRGSRLADFARERGLVAIAFAGDTALLREHLRKGRPLVVALSAGRDAFHDVVVVGFDDERRELIVNDPDFGAGRRLSERELVERWTKSGNWTLLVQPAGESEPVAGPAASGGEPPSAVGEKPEAGTAVVEAAEPAADASYDEVVARAIGLGRSGEQARAAALLDRALGLSPERPEAWAERGGLRFLEGRYEDAVSDLRRSTAIRDDPYARDLLASSLQLAGREMEALATWNAIGKPTLGTVEIGGLQRTRDEVARREIGLARGATLTPSAIRRAHRRLDETGVFERITIRPRPLGDGSADLQVALSERYGFAHGPIDFLVGTGVGLAWQRLHLRYANLAGTGISLGGSYRWQTNRPESALQLDWPRPLALPLYLRVAGVRGEQAYDLGELFAVRSRGIALGVRHVLEAGPVLSLGLRLDERTVSRERPDAKPGRIVGLDLGLEGRLVDGRRQRLDGSVRLFGAGGAVASDLDFGRVEAQLRYEAVVSKPEGRSVERSVFAARLRAGSGSGGMPVDEMYAPGMSLESDLPLRAHPLTRHGVIGANPVGRSIILLNTEWRQRVLHRPMFDVALAALGDAADVWRPAEGGEGGMLVDVGIGLRVSLIAGATVRIDHAWGLRDGRRALFVGLNQTF